MKTHNYAVCVICCALMLLSTLAAQTPAISPHQPRNANLTSIAALTTTTYGRSVLTSADAAALRTLAGLGSLATLSTVTSSQIDDLTIVSGDIANGTIIVGKLDSAAYSTGGLGSADVGKLVQFASNGQLNTTVALTVNALLGASTGYGQLQPDNIAFGNVAGTFGRTYTLSLPVIGGTRFVYLPATSGTIARLEDITPAQLTQSGATTGQGIVWNGTSWAPGTVGGSIVVNSTPADGDAGNLLYTDGTKVQQYAVVPSLKGGTGASNAGTLTLPNDTSITGGGTIVLGGLTFTVPANGTAALRNVANTFSLYNTVTLGTNSPTPANGFGLINSTAATAGVQSASPLMLWQGRGWKTTSPGSQTVLFQAFALPVQGASAPSGLWKLQSSVNGAAAVDVLSVSTTGAATVSGPLTFGGSSSSPLSIVHNSGTLSFISTGSGEPLWSHSFVFPGNGFMRFGFSGATDPIIQASASKLTLSQMQTLQLGADTNADAADQIVQAASGITGTDRSGGDLTVASGNSTGAGASAVIFKVPVAGASGTTARTAVERARVDGNGIKAGKIIIWGDSTTEPPGGPTGDFYYLYVDPADQNLKIKSGVTGNTTTIASP